MAKRIIDVVNRPTARTWLALLVTLLPAPVRLKKPDGTVVTIPAAEITKSRGGS